MENLSILTKPQKCLIFKANNELKNLKTMLNNLNTETKSYVGHIEEALRDVKKIFGETPPDIFIVIGSCGKDLIKELSLIDQNSKRLNCWDKSINQNIDQSINPQSLKNYLPQPIKEGHYGTLYLFSVGGKSIMLQEGRAHVYENQDVGSLTLMVRMMGLWGTEFFMTTSSSRSIPGGLESNLDNSSEESNIAIIVDHINEANESPLTGISLGGKEGVGKLRPYEVNMANVYDEALRRKFLEKFKIFNLTEKVYVFIKDISYSTPAELKKFSEIDGVVGVSLVPETVAAYQAGMRVVAFTEYAKHRSKKFAPNPYFIDVLLKSIEYMLDIKIKLQPQKQEENTEAV